MKKQVKSCRAKVKLPWGFFFYFFVWSLSLGLFVLPPVYGAEGETNPGKPFTLFVPPFAYEAVGESESKHENWTAVHFLKDFAQPKKGEGSPSGISNSDINKEQFLRFLNSWSWDELSKEQKEQAFKTIQTVEGNNLFHLIAQVSYPSVQVKDTLLLILNQAQDILGAERLLHMLTQRNNQGRTPFSLASDDSIKHRLGQFEFKARGYLERLVRDNVIAGGLWGFFSAVMFASTVAPYDISFWPEMGFVMGSGGMVASTLICYTVFKTNRSLSNSR